MSNSLQHWVGRNRPPRVQITYDVEIGDAVEKKELPLVVGLLADLSGKPVKPLPKLKERRFVEIDRDHIQAAFQECDGAGFAEPRHASGDDGGHSFGQLHVAFLKFYSAARLTAAR